MKTKSLIAACLAGVGIYLVVTGSMTVVFSLSMLTSDYGDPSTRSTVIAQYLVLGMPFFVGVLFVTFAFKLASLICRVAKTEETFTGIIQPEVAIVVACVVTGLLLAITQLPELVQLVVKQFLVSASAAYAADHRYEDYRLLMVHPGVYSLLALLVVWKAKFLARWLVTRYEKP